METRLLLFRHAETSDPRRIHGFESDIGLSERGLGEAYRVGEILARLDVNSLTSSGMRRARSTAEPIAEAIGIPLRIEPDLHERRMGVLSGQPHESARGAYLEVVQAWMAGEIDASNEGGESFRMVRGRVLPILEGIAQHDRGGTQVVICHGLVIRVVLVSWLERLSMAQFRDVEIPFLGAHDLRWDGQTWRDAALSVTDWEQLIDA